MTKKKRSKTFQTSQTPEKTNPFLRAHRALKNETFLFVCGALLSVLAIFLAIACVSFLFSGGVDQSILESNKKSVTETITETENRAGRSGASISEYLINSGFGLASFILPIFIFICGTNLMKITQQNLLKWFISSSFLIIWLSIFLHMAFSWAFSNSFIRPGGCHGLNVTNWLIAQIGTPGAILALILTMLFFAIYLTGETIVWIRSKFGLIKDKTRQIIALPGNDLDDETDKKTTYTENILTAQAAEIDNNLNINCESKQIDQKDLLYNNKNDLLSIDTAVDDIGQSSNSESGKEDSSITEIQLEITENSIDEIYKGPQLEPYNPRLDLSYYKFPSTNLLNYHKDTALSIDMEEQNANKNRIIHVLRNFGIEISSIAATVGPTITLYEITPAPGVRISKIRNLEDDIALSLSALGIRIIAPIPGKGTIGIEVPNAKPLTVSIHSIISSRKFVKSNFELPVALGKTITNEVLMFDLVKMPHLLVAGATGMGKSVGLNTIVTSLLYKKHPAELKLVMVDPKMVEFNIYSPIEKHFLAKMPEEKESIITDVTKVVHTLKSLCIEMDNRYELLKKANVRAITEYNNLFNSRKLNPEKGHRFMPYIVVVIDEFGDLIMTAGREIEIPITRIAQKARAVGMHMIIATQRPTANIITGNIKANFPARISFRVASMVDSRTIIDRPGANQLIGRGDMLFLQGGNPVRVQCAFVDTPEVQRICKHISSQQGYTTAYELPEYIDESSSESGYYQSIETPKIDPLFIDAAKLVVNYQQGSTSLIQRKFSIGYNRAGRIMDQMERAGIVGPAEGSKPRQVLCLDESDLEFKINGVL
ncbi:MAG TPA: DNA translocase FtsK [Bacteroidaceae bacterium]|nr:DNA translocase FtsK [Bacteroidaceae bacterium]